MITEHPWIAAIAVTLAGAVAFTLILLLVIAPAAGKIPGKVTHYYRQHPVCFRLQPGRCGR